MELFCSALYVMATHCLCPRHENSRDVR